MAERAKPGAKTAFPRTRTFGTRAVSASQRFSWLLSRESLLRLMLSFVLALALWLYVTGRQDPTIAWDYGQPLPISTANVPPGMTVVNDLGSVRVRIRVDNRNRVVTPESFQTIVNLQGLRPGLHHVPVQVIANPGIQVLKRTPARVPVLLDRLQTKHVPVRWRFLDRPPTGYSMGNVHVDPSTVAVSGPQSLVSQVDHTTVYIYLSQGANVEGTYKPSAENSQNKPVTGHLLLDPPEVHVVASVIANLSYKTVPILASLVGQPKAGLGVTGVTVTPAEITVRGSPSKLESLTSLATAPIVLSGRGGKGFTAEAKVALPHGMASGIKVARVAVRLGPVNVSSTVSTKIVPTNLRRGLTARIQPASILTTVAGPSAQLGKAKNDIQATLNLSSYAAGKYRLKPTVHAPHGVSIVNTYPETVTVRLKHR